MFISSLWNESEVRKGYTLLGYNNEIDVVKQSGASAITIVAISVYSAGGSVSWEKVRQYNQTFLHKYKQDIDFHNNT